MNHGSLSSRSFSACVVLSLLCGCGAAAPTPAPPPELPLKSLLAYASGSPDYVVVIRPGAVLETTEAREITDALMPSDWLDRFARRYGVRFETLEAAAYASYPSGSVMMVRGDDDPDAVVRALGSRMTGVDASHEEPAQRVGFLGMSRHHVATLDRDTVMIARGAAREAQNTLERARHAEPGTDGREGAPISLLIPRHLNLPLDVGASVLFAGQRAVAATLTPRDGRVDCDVRFAGEFPDGAEENFAALFRSLAGSDLGQVLGMDEALSTLSIRGSTNRVQVTFSLSTQALTQGLRMLFVAEMPELLDSHDDQ